MSAIAFPLTKEGKLQKGCTNPCYIKSGSDKEIWNQWSKDGFDDLKSN